MSVERVLQEDNTGGHHNTGTMACRLEGFFLMCRSTCVDAIHLMAGDVVNK